MHDTRCLCASIALAVFAAGCGEVSQGGSAPPEVAEDAPDPAPRHTNRLARETSPYLLQHAHNPVDWYAWGEEAFEAARRLDRPIFLSIGYSTCYWCHVMERESFEDEQTAALMNEHFVSIKMDREERPDADDIYMAAVVTLTGRGGWPMSVFLEPQGLRPFAGGTYFPPQPRYGKPSFRQLLQQMADRWRDDRAGVLREADRVAASVRRRLTGLTQPQPLDASVLQRAAVGMVSGFDAEFGGFQRGRPKFPQPARLAMLMALAWEDPTARDAIVRTLEKMAMGGIYDQVGGGFHRYSTDRQWLVPHFEKMLYDNAQLASIYARAYELTRDRFYEKITRETLDYVLREMTGAHGAFFSAQDAEAGQREGKSYVWSPQEVRSALAAAGLDQLYDIAVTVYGLQRPNFRDPHHPSEPARNVLHLTARPEALAGDVGVETDAFYVMLAQINQALLAVRDTREQPITDDKVLTAWNGLMIKAMVDGARALGERRYLEAAQRAARFILDTMQTSDGGLLRTYRDGRPRINAFSVDYALLVDGLLTLHRATGETAWLDAAERLTDTARERFRDSAGGAYFDTLAGQSDLFVRTMTRHDGVVPAANTVMLSNLLDLAELTGQTSYLDDAAGTLVAMSSQIARSPVSAALATVALQRFLQEYPDLVPGAGAAVTARPPVEVSASASTVEVSGDSPARLELTLTIRDGYHLNAHEPGVEGALGVQVVLVGQGFALEPEYPDGEPYRIAQFGDPLLVHAGSVTIPVTIRRTGPGSGRARIMVTYQVCTDQYCLAPARALVPVVITGRPP